MALFRGTGGSGDASTDTYASEVAVEATRASTKANEAAASATSAASSASDSNSSALLALSAQFQADLFKQQAETSETNAGSFATQAGNSAQTAVLAKIGADTAQSAAEVAKTAAETAETNAETAETNASTSATTATTKAGEASTSASSASTSATSASTSATSAATSATAAQTAQTAAEAAQSAAETAKEAIDGLYLGTASSNPTVDGNGDAVTVGDWYFNTSDNTTRIYDGSTWNTINPDLVGDTTPQLGGNLDLNSRNITGTGNVDITGSAKLTGSLKLPSNNSGLLFHDSLNGTEVRVDSSDNLTVKALGEIIFNANNGEIKIKDGSSAFAGQIDLADNNNVTVSALISDRDLIFKGKDSSSVITALTLDMSDAGKALFNSGASFGSDVNVTGNVVLSGTVDGRDVAADGTKLDGVEASADVTDATNVTAAGALMDSEVTNLAQVKAFDTTDYATAAQGAKADTAHGWGDHSTEGYLTGNQTITLSGAVTGSGTTSITTTLSTIDGGTY